MSSRGPHQHCYTASWRETKLRGKSGKLEFCFHHQLKLNVFLAVTLLLTPLITLFSKLAAGFYFELCNAGLTDGTVQSVDATVPCIHTFKDKFRLFWWWFILIYSFILDKAWIYFFILHEVIGASSNTETIRVRDMTTPAISLILYLPVKTSNLSFKKYISYFIVSYDRILSIQDLSEVPNPWKGFSMNRCLVLALVVLLVSAGVNELHGQCCHSDQIGKKNNNLFIGEEKKTFNGSLF